MVKGVEGKAEGQAKVGGRGSGTERLTSAGKEESGFMEENILCSTPAQNFSSEIS